MVVVDLEMSEWKLDREVRKLEKIEVGGECIAQAHNHLRLSLMVDVNGLGLVILVILVILVKVFTVVAELWRCGVHLRASTVPRP
jgi:hypothetical protein